MRSYISVLLLIGVLGVVPLCHAQPDNTGTSMEKVNKETRDLLQAVGSYTADKKQQAVREAKEALDKLDKRIESLEAKIDKNWDKMNDTVRGQTRENLRALRKQRNKVAEWYGSMKTSSADAWDHMKTGFSEAYMELVDAWEQAENEFGSKK